MASNGIRDRVAIVGMGCTTFGEHWDRSVSDLLVDSSQEALNSANVPIARGLPASMMAMRSHRRSASSM